MARRKNTNDSLTAYIFYAVIIFVALTLFIPVIGVGSSTSTLWIDIVDFFTKINDHFQAYWMFYTFGLALIFAVLKQKKR